MPTPIQVELPGDWAAGLSFRLGTLRANANIDSHDEDDGVVEEAQGMFEEEGEDDIEEDEDEEEEEDDTEKIFEEDEVDLCLRSEVSMGSPTSMGFNGLYNSLVRKHNKLVGHYNKLAEKLEERDQDITRLRERMDRQRGPHSDAPQADDADESPLVTRPKTTPVQRTPDIHGQYKRQRMESRQAQSQSSSRRHSAETSTHSGPQATPVRSEEGIYDQSPIHEEESMSVPQRTKSSAQARSKPQIAISSEDAMPPTTPSLHIERPSKRRKRSSSTSAAAEDRPAGHLTYTVWHTVDGISQPLTTLPPIDLRSAALVELRKDLRKGMEAVPKHRRGNDNHWAEYGKRTGGCIFQWIHNQGTTFVRNDRDYAVCRACFNAQRPCLRYHKDRGFYWVPLPAEVREGIEPTDMEYFIYPEKSASRKVGTSIWEKR